MFLPHSWPSFFFPHLTSFLAQPDSTLTHEYDWEYCVVSFEPNDSVIPATFFKSRLLRDSRFAAVLEKKIFHA